MRDTHVTRSNARETTPARGLPSAGASPRPILYLSAVGAALLLGAVLCAAPAPAQEKPGDRVVEPDYRVATMPEPAPSPFLLRRTDVRTVVTGPIAHTIVRQEWENPNADPVEGEYIFPLPENAAVTGMRLTIGSRVIEAEIRRREEARAAYERARAEGRVAGLLDQERPNIFAQRVANIMPGMRIEVALELDQEIRCEGGDCEFDFPTVVGPRFVPCRQGDPGRIEPPVTLPGTTTGQRLTFEATLDAGVPIHDLRSPSHRMEIDQGRSGRALVRLAGSRDARGDDHGPVSGDRLDRDIRLQWRIGGREPEVGVLAWRDPRDPSEPGVFTIVVAPPAGAPGDDAAGLDDRYAAPRELVFVLDCSGSMRGVPLEASKNVVRRALRTLRPGDTFRIIRFSDRASGLGDRPLVPTPANLRRALDYLTGLRGSGGTEMLSGIRAALDLAADPERLRIVAFLTDGYIGNEAEILGQVRRRIGDARLFSFGIGSSVNRYLLENLAQEGRGAAAFLGARETPDALVDRFVERIATPVLTGVRISWEGIDVEDQEPAAVPDLFAGQPLVIHGRYRTPGAGALVVEGRLGGRRVTLREAVTLPAYAADHEALGRLWARARVDRLTRESYGRLSPRAVEEVTALGLRHHLMTPYTSLVAIDRDVSNFGAPAAPVTVPVEMPQDVSYEGVFGARGAVTGKVQGGFAGPAMRQAIAPFAAPGPQPAPPAPPARPDRTAAADAGGRAEEASRPRIPQTAPAAAIDFVQLVLIEEDGTRRTIESDGDAWIEDGRSRRLVRALTSEALDALRAALAAARPDDWRDGEATWARGRSRLVIVTAGGATRGAALPAGDPAVERLARLVREATSD